MKTLFNAMAFKVVRYLKRISSAHPTTVIQTLEREERWGVDRGEMKEWCECIFPTHAETEMTFLPIPRTAGIEPDTSDLENEDI